MSDTTPYAEAIDHIAELAGEPTPHREFTQGRHRYVIAYAPDNWTEHFTDLTVDQDELPRPLQPRGTLIAGDLPSLVALIAKHATPEAEVYADERSGQIVAVLDGGLSYAVGLDDEVPYTTDEGASLRATWADHRASLTLLADPDWNAWAEIDGKFVSQSHMADHLETYRHTIVTPDAATVLEIAQSIEVSSDAKFRSGVRNASGARTLVMVGTDTATAGTDGTLTIPNELTVRLRPYVDAGREPVTALFRYRIERGELLLGVKLLQLADVRKRAWATLVAELRDSLTAALDADRAATVLVVNGQAPRARR